MKKVTFFAGHGKAYNDTTYDSGAVGQGHHEHLMMKEFGEILGRYLNGKVDYKMITEGNFADGVAGYDDAWCDFGLTGHCNASTNQSANGSEMYKSDSAIYNNSFAINVLNFMSSLGFSNRGLKPEPFPLYNLDNGGDFYSETFFISNTADFNRWQANKYKIGEYVANEILRALGISTESITNNGHFMSWNEMDYRTSQGRDGESVGWCNVKGAYIEDDNTIGYSDIKKRKKVYFNSWQGMDIASDMISSRDGIVWVKFRDLKGTNGEDVYLDLNEKGKKHFYYDGDDVWAWTK